MIFFNVDNKEVNMGEISVHMQKVPKPGGHQYELTISLDETEALKELELLVKKRHNEEDFCEKLLSSTANFYNPINYIYHYLVKRKRIKSANAKWMINTIKNVFIERNHLVIKGEASEFIEDFDTYYS